MRNQTNWGDVDNLRGFASGFDAPKKTPAGAAQTGYADLLRARPRPFFHPQVVQDVQVVNPVRAEKALSFWQKFKNDRPPFSP